MTDLVQMIAIEAGTVVGPEGIVHVNPESKRENGRYSHPLVTEATAQLLEQRKLALRAGDDLVMVKSTVDQSTELTEEQRAMLGDPDTVFDNPGGTPVAKPIDPPVAKPAAPVAGEAAGSTDGGTTTGAAGTAGGTDEIATGLSENDPDAPPVAAAAPVAKPAAPVAGKAPKPARQS